MMGTAITTIFISVQTTSQRLGPSRPTPKSCTAFNTSVMSGTLHRYLAKAATQSLRFVKRRGHTYASCGHGVVQPGRQGNVPLGRTDANVVAIGHTQLFQVGR